MRFAICNETFQNWSWEDTCGEIARQGYEGVEIAPFTLAEDVRTLNSARRRDIARVASVAGLEVVGLHWLLVSPKGMSVTARDERIRSATSEYLCALVDLCADLGGRIMVLGSPAQRRIPEGDTAEVATERLIGCLQAPLERAALSGITVCLEPLPPPEADLILNLAAATEVVGRVGSPALKTIFDVKSASSEGAPLGELLRAYRPLIGHVHANDANRRGPGFGDTDFRPIMSALKETDYDAYVSVEVFDYSPDPVTIADQSLQYLRSTLVSLNKEPS